MIISQTINHISGDSFDVDIRVTDIPEDFFLSIGETTFSDDGFIREIEIEMLPLSNTSGGTKIINSGVFSKKEEESVIKVSVSQAGIILGWNNQVYN
ncbi:MAG: hypothetical protein AB8H03_26030 [Saprospiraceae bacterium]